ncbi:unnamed protein product [Amoebophrya sp. A25]|nr:unnamed protein product [Amoebophrya sp. A25]|eukprot:GSA25T00007799001.1
MASPSNTVRFLPQQPAEIAFPDILVNVGRGPNLQGHVRGRYKHLRHTSSNSLSKDCFFCSHNGLYIYAAGENEYAIGPRLGGQSYIAKICSGDVLLGEILVWSVREQEFVKHDDVDIWIDGDLSHQPAHEIEDFAPQAVRLLSKCENIAGGYRIVPKTCCDRPVYVRTTAEEVSAAVGGNAGAATLEQTDESQELYFGREHQPVPLYILYIDGRWVVTPNDTITMQSGFSFLAESRSTSAYFPTECAWKEGLVVEEVVEAGAIVGDFEAEPFDENTLVVRQEQVVPSAPTLLEEPSPAGEATTSTVGKARRKPTADGYQEPAEEVEAVAAAPVESPAEPEAVSENYTTEKEHQEDSPAEAAEEAEVAADDTAEAAAAADDAEQKEAGDAEAKDAEAGAETVEGNEEDAKAEDGETKSPKPEGEEEAKPEGDEAEKTEEKEPAADDETRKEEQGEAATEEKPDGDAHKDKEEGREETAEQGRTSDEVEAKGDAAEADEAVANAEESKEEKEEEQAGEKKVEENPIEGEIAAAPRVEAVPDALAETAPAMTDTDSTLAGANSTFRTSQQQNQTTASGEQGFLGSSTVSASSRGADNVRIVYSCPSSATFVDPLFPPSSRSISPSAEDVPDDVYWYRGHHLSPSLLRPQLFDHVQQPTNLLQGNTGDLSLLGTLGLLTEFPNYIKARLFRLPTDPVSVLNGSYIAERTGKYFVNLFDVAQRDWTTIEVDDYIPCRARRWYNHRPKPLLSQPQGNELCALLIEKALAKMAGSYAAVANMPVPYILTHLTGCEEQEVWDLNGRATKSVVSVQYRRQHPRDLQRLFTQSSGESMSYREFFSYLREAEHRNYVVAAAIAPRPGKQVEKRRPDGLVEASPYGVLEARIVSAVSGPSAGQSVCLIKMRNLWGPSCLWNGAYSALAPEWLHIENPTLHNTPTAADSFWMEYTDFLAVFGKVYVSRMGMAAARYGRQQSFGSDQFELVLAQLGPES